MIGRQMKYIFIFIILIQASGIVFGQSKNDTLADGILKERAKVDSLYEISKIKKQSSWLRK
jgi:hypothetical protein